VCNSVPQAVLVGPAVAAPLSVVGQRSRAEDEVPISPPHTLHIQLTNHNSSAFNSNDAHAITTPRASLSRMSCTMLRRIRRFFNAMTQIESTVTIIIIALLLGFVSATLRLSDIDGRFVGHDMVVTVSYCISGPMLAFAGQKLYDIIVRTTLTLANQSTTATLTIQRQSYWFAVWTVANFSSLILMLVVPTAQETLYILHLAGSSIYFIIYYYSLRRYTLQLMAILSRGLDTMTVNQRAVREAAIGALRIRLKGGIPLATVGVVLGIFAMWPWMRHRGAYIFPIVAFFARAAFISQLKTLKPPPTSPSSHVYIHDAPLPLSPHTAAAITTVPRTTTTTITGGYEAVRQRNDIQDKNDQYEQATANYTNGTLPEAGMISTSMTNHTNNSSCGNVSNFTITTSTNNGVSTPIASPNRNAPTTYTGHNNDRIFVTRRSPQ
jgi:hypothetical protein